jgi:hypothetical protein
MHAKTNRWQFGIGSIDGLAESESWETRRPAGRVGAGSQKRMQLGGRSFWISSMLSPGTRRTTWPRYNSDGCDPYMAGPSAANTIVNSSDNAIPYVLVLHISRSMPTWHLHVYIYNCSSSTTFVFSILSKCGLALLWQSRNNPVASPSAKMKKGKGTDA